MGGTNLAWDVVSSAIKANKHVVTANKTLIAARLDDLVALLKEHRRVHFFYEAAVCGGIPVINTIRRGLACDDVTEVCGIMNGTTNYILWSMGVNALGYDAALKAAQEQGFAEATPTADVEGHDARAKLCILAKLCFGLSVDEGKIFCEGITRVSKDEFAYAKMLQKTVKLVARAKLSPPAAAGGTAQLDVYVSPVMVDLTEPMARVDREANLVTVYSKMLGESSLVGAGAGRYPSANSVVADVYELRSLLRDNPRGDARSPFPEVTRPVAMREDFAAEFYLRLVVDDKPGIIHRVSGALQEENISIFSILQTPIEDPKNVPFAIITEKCQLSQMKRVCEKFSSGRAAGGAFNFLKQEPFFMIAT